MPWLASLLMALCAVEPLPPADPNDYQVFDLTGILSPTALVRVDKHWYVGADLNDVEPGIFRLAEAPVAGQWSGRRVKSLPQLAIEALYHDTDTRSLRIVVERKFSAFEQDWASAVHHLGLPAFNLVDQWTVDLPNTCYSGLMQCGMAAAIPLSQNRWLFFKKRNPSRVYLYEKTDQSIRLIKTAPVGINRRHVVISDVQLIGDQLVFLLKDRWSLARIPLAHFTGRWPPSHQLEPFFSFKGLSKPFYVHQRRLRLEGLAEAFAWDDQGRLMILLNNRGFPYFARREGTLTDHPKLIRFAAPATVVDPTTDMAP